MAGIAAAVPLAEAGLSVDIIEKRPLLGGRASSHIDPVTAHQIDECQHGTMRCCTSLSDLLNRLGVADQIRYHDAIQFLDGDGRRSVIKGCGLPAPLHTSLSFLLFRSLGVRDKMAIARGMLAMLRGGEEQELEGTNISDWFARLRQTDRAIKRFWSPILVSACNETIDRISCTHAFKIFRDGFLLNHEAFHFGVPCVPLGTLYTEPAISYLARYGGRVRLKTIVDKVIVEERANGPAVGGLMLQNGESLMADHYVFALQSDLLLKLLPSSLTAATEYWEPIRGIEFSPIIGVHLWFDKAIDCPEALSTLDRETEWIFNKNRNFNQADGSSSYLSAVISASRRYSATSKEEILSLVLADLNACLPETIGANLVKWQVVKWPKATFSPLPGVEKLRPIQQSPVSNLYVAGEWTKTGWPSTMESAARSGYMAAEAILRQEGTHTELVPRPLPVGRLAALLAKKIGA